jgi:hypothetical protein
MRGVFCYCTVMVMHLFVFTDSVPASHHKATVLEQKLFEIASLRVKIIDKIDQAIEMRTLLNHQLEDLLKEVQGQQMRSGIKSYQSALQNSRINNNLKLIQLLLGYIEMLNRRITYFQNGNETLKFLLDQVNDDIAMIQTLEDMEINRLIEKIDAVLDEYIPETEKQIINTAKIQLLPAEKIWDRVLVQPN